MIEKQSSFNSHFTNPQEWFCPKYPFFFFSICGSGMFNLNPTTNACFHSILRSLASVQVKGSHLNWDLNCGYLFRFPSSKYFTILFRFVEIIWHCCLIQILLLFSLVWITLRSSLDHGLVICYTSKTRLPYWLYCSIKTLTEQLHMGSMEYIIIIVLVNKLCLERRQNNHHQFLLNALYRYLNETFSLYIHIPK